MTLTTTTGQNTALASPVVREAYFVELDLATATQYLSSLNFPMTWGGHTWIGAGSIGSISAISEAQSLTTSSVSLVINSAQVSWLALAVGSVSEYRGRPVKIYYCPLDTGYGLIDTPILCWSGVMDIITLGITGSESNIALKCETSAFGLKRANSFRVNAAQQKQVYPTDTGFDYLSDLITNPAVWLTVAFEKSVGPYANA